MATVVLGAVGAGVGAFVGKGNFMAIQKGWAIGTTIGGLIDASNRKPVSAEVGKLTDLRYSGSNYGTVIPKVWGKTIVAGNIIWFANYLNGSLTPSGTANSIHFVEHKEASGGGGGGSGGGGGASSTDYWYSASFAVAFCEASTFKSDGTFVNRNPVIKRIWANDILIYDVDTPSNNKVTIRFHYGSETETADSLISTAEGAAYAPAYRGLVYVVIQDLNLKPYSNSVPSIKAEIWTNSVTVGDICSDVCGQVNLDSSLVDVSLATAAVKGYVVTNRGTAQAILEPLTSTFFVDISEVDRSIRFVPRGGVTYTAISSSDIGAGKPGSDFVNSFTTKLGVRGELPGRVDLTYFDLDKGFLQVTQTDIKQSADFLNPTQISVPITMSANEARQTAGRVIDSAYLELDPITFHVSDKFRYLSTTDVIMVSCDDFANNDGRYRIIKIDESPQEEITIIAVKDEPLSLTQITTGSYGVVSGASNNTVPIPCTFTAWSGIELREFDRASAGFYVAATWANNGAGGGIYYSTNGGTSWSYGGYAYTRAPFGAASTALADGTGYAVWDNSNTVDVTITNDGTTTLSSVTNDDVLNGTNIAVLGNEILGFATVQVLGSYSYRLSTIRRGIRTSPYTGHLNTDKFIVTNQDCITRITVADTYVGTSVLVKVVAPGQTLADVTAVSVTIAARNPTDIETRLDAIDSPKNANLVYAGPSSGGPSSPTFRSLVNSDLPNLASSRIKGRATAGTGSVEDLTGTQVTAMLDTVTSSLKGVVPAPGSPTGRFLKDDLTWATVGTPAGSNTHVQFNNSGSFGGSANFTWDGSNLYVNGSGFFGLAASSLYRLAAYKQETTSSPAYVLYAQQSLTGGVGAGSYPAAGRVREDVSSGTNAVGYAAALQAIAQITPSQTTGVVSVINGADFSVRYNCNTPGASTGNIFGGLFQVTSDNTSNQGTITNIFGGYFTGGLLHGSSATVTSGVVGGYFRVIIPSAMLTGSGYATSIALANPNVPAGGANFPGNVSHIRLEDFNFTANSGNKYPVFFNSTANDAGRNGIWWGSDANNVALFRASNDTVGSNKSFSVARRITTGIISLTAGASIATDASLGNIARVTVNQNFTLSNPTSAIDGQTIRWEILQDATGGRTITWGSAFVNTFALTTTANTRTIFEAFYVSATSKWYISNSYMTGV